MKKQTLYNKHWYRHHRRHALYLNYRCVARNFLRHYATLKDLSNIDIYCQQRIRGEGK